MSLWYDEQGTRRGVLSEDAFQEALDNAGAVVLFLAANPASTVSAVAAGVAGVSDERRAQILLDRLVSAGLATEAGGDYSSVLIEGAG